MIFSPNKLKEIEQAIEKRDEDYFLSRLQSQSGKRIPQKIHFSSVLMVSAHKAKYLNKIDELSADALILNLEDGVAPAMKRIALLTLCYFLQHVPQNVPMLIIRINALNNGGREEISFLNRYSPDAIRVPKVCTRKDIEEARRLIDPSIALHASWETREAFHNIYEIVKAGAEVLYLGILDLLADLSLPQSIIKLGNPTIDYILAKFLIETRSAGAEAVSFVYQDYKDLEGFSDWCEHEKEIGYEAKVCISPKQVEIANRILKRFDIEKALYIKERFESMAQKGVTGFCDERYGFIDEPIYKDALEIIKKSQKSNR